MKRFWNNLLPGLLVLFCVSSVHAGINIGGTRVIYDGGKKEAAIGVSNPDNVPYLIQSWFENQDNIAGKIPFIITPPLYRLDRGQENVMRIVRAGNLPDNKESMYWLNIKAIPAAEKKANSLQIAVKTRIKLIYRPVSLKRNDPEDFAKQLIWKIAANRISVSNPGNYYMNFNEITVAGKSVPEPTYVAPGASATFSLPAGVSAGPVTFKLINDFGGVGPTHHAAI
ncbi:molecular chaperone [Leclercia adecarboxylata]|uniref:Molecular chaperone n=1 Tax=Leclercia adecarboxylata TaxID=83655 RepID=A0A9X3YE97_9ENTR|nr:molecular chaperone [Leclercia adecarboxylata]MBD1403491.1 molecular chaperone [Leclercia adecarboxylata]MDC6621119.1 molecular chaperone [Leclercia adecarboxylata]MDC6631694.1 molecular chaperone [Leclercia adecarboxylata]MDC6640484.1 molecular chaperone [Leclercia adecarboxylata]MDC6651268.1 molecular chaperone [Leclercia adecarboxylata]